MFERLMKKLNIKSVKVAKILLFGIIGICGIFLMLFINEQRNTAVVLVGTDAQDNYEAEPVYTQWAEMPIVSQTIVVYISGEVRNPGVFEFDYGARIVDAIEAAGGMTNDADPNAINLSARLFDEQHIVVFSMDDNMPPSAQATGGGMAGVTADGLVNINTATSEQLQVLSGIGPVTAGNIISHRDARGGFATIEEIMNVSGIGERTFENIRDRITVD